MTTDMQLYSEVLAELAWDPRVREKEIGVAVKDGVVTLTGAVVSLAAMLLVSEAVERVAGVKAVANDLTVKIPGALARSDTEIAHHVVDLLAGNSHATADTIQSGVTCGWVTLKDRAQWDWDLERDAASLAVRKVLGVRGVTNATKVTSHRGFARV